MNVTDPIADMLTRIRNGAMAKKDVVSIPASKMKVAIANILKKEGFIRAFKCVRDDKQGMIKIALKYREDKNKTSVIKILERVSTPGRRVYINATQTPFVKYGYGIGIVSTSNGVMTCRDARKSNIGGEYLCKAY